MFITFRSTCATCHIALSLGFIIGYSYGAQAETLPGPADVSRIKPEESLILPAQGQDQQITIPNPVPTMPVPAGASAIRFTLKQVQLTGVTAFTPEQLADIYAPYVNKEITLDIAYKIASTITERYRNAGYFLSLATLPQQRIKDGTITIDVTEGAIGKVDAPDDITKRGVIQGYIARLQAQKPVTIQAVERFLLQLNDLPGLSFRAVLSPLTDSADGVIKLTLIPTAKTGRGSITFDNFSSRFLGPDELSAAYSISLLPLQQTTISGLSALPVKRLHYGALDHTIAIAPDIMLDVNGGITRAHPGYTLDKDDIDSDEKSFGFGASYQWLRQREQNLSFKLSMDNENVTSDLLDAPLTRDHIRAVRASMLYDRTDGWYGANSLNATISRGINGLGASDKDDPYLSRTGALPDFTKAQLLLSRLQGMGNDWSLLASATGQISSATLYSSEEFGYGGQSFGRAYDNSEILGDDGVAGSLELRYSGLHLWQPVALTPYSFYDIGKIWDKQREPYDAESGASAGFGLRVATEWHETGNLGIAFPLTRDIATPLYSNNGRNPRLIFQISQDF